MQTFLPHEDFEQSAQVLDNSRLNKQTVEVKQIYNALTNPEAKGWKNHPATIMWQGYEVSLLIYGWTMCQEWERRGHKTKLTKEFCDLIVGHRFTIIKNPHWLGDERVHSSHRYSLLSKNFGHYSKFDWPETEVVQDYLESFDYLSTFPSEYYWPVQKKSQ